MTITNKLRTVAGEMANLVHKVMVTPLSSLRASPPAGQEPRRRSILLSRRDYGLQPPVRSAEYMLLLSTAVEAAANGIVITDRRGVVEWVNPAFSKITGYTREEIVGQTLRVLKSGQQPEAFYHDFWQTILAGKIWHGELLNRHHDGHLYVEEQTVAPVRGKDGSIMHFIGVKQDITRRKQYEETLERRNAELVEMTAIISAITSSLNVDNVISAIVNFVHRLLPQTSGATIQMVQAGGRLITRAASSGLAESDDPVRFAPGRGIADVAFRDRTIVNVGDVEHDPRFAPAEAPPAYRSLVAVPISSGRQVLGVLSVESQEQNAFAKHEEHLLSLFVGYAAVAIRHASEYEGRVQAETELKRYSERLASMVDERTVELKAAQERLLEQHHLEQEIVLAAQVQASILPHSIPDLVGYEFAGVALAARYVSGDMYDWIALSPEHCSLALADIAGKGVPAAMMTSSARALLRHAAARKSSPGRTLSNLNRFLYSDLTHADMFITVVAANLDGRTATVDYASAGHTEVIWYKSRTKTCERLPATGLPIGVMPRNVVKEKRIFLCPGDLLVFYSDGVTEAENDVGGFFGTSRLIDLVSKNTALSATALAQAIVQAVDAFATSPRSDDLTMIVVKVLPRTVSFAYPADFEHMSQTMELIRTLLRAYDDDFAYQFELAASEVVTNIIEHAYQDWSGELRGEVKLDTNTVQLDLYDDGQPFDITTLPTPQPTEACESGYGVHIMRQLMNELSYTAATSAGNHWRLVKARPRQDAGS